MKILTILVSYDKEIKSRRVIFFFPTKDSNSKVINIFTYEHFERYTILFILNVNSKNVYKIFSRTADVRNWSCLLKV